MQHEDLFTNQPLKVEVVKFKINGWKGKTILLVFAPVVFIICLPFLAYLYFWPHSCRIHMYLPDKKIEVIFKYPDRLCADDKIEAKIKVNIDGKDIYPITCILETRAGSSHSIGFFEKEFKKEIIFDKQELDYRPKIQLSEVYQGNKCEFQFGVKTQNMSEAQYSEFHSIKIAKILLQPDKIMSTIAAAIVGIVTGLATTVIGVIVSKYIEYRQVFSKSQNDNLQLFLS